MFEEAIGREKAKTVMGRLEERRRHERPFVFVEREPAELTARALAEESDAVAALVLAHLPSDLAAEILSSFGPERALELVKRMTTLFPPGYEALDAVATNFKERLAIYAKAPNPKEPSVRLKSIAQMLTFSEPETEKGVLEGLTAWEVFRTRTYWLIVAAILLAAVPSNGLMTFLAAVLGERGFEASQTANFLSIFTIAGAIGTIIGGFALDRFQTAKISAPFTLFSLAAFVILGSISAAHGGAPMLFLAAALFGFSFGAHRPMGGYFHTRFFGLRSFTTVFAVQMAIMALLFGIAAPFTGWVRETTGSYDVMIWATVAGLVVSAGIYLILGPYRYAKEIGAVAQASSPPPERPIEFATRSET